MSIKELEAKAQTIKELQRMQEELAEEIASALKKELPELAARFTKETTSRRFTVA